MDHNLPGFGLTQDGIDFQIIVRYLPQNDSLLVHEGLPDQTLARLHLQSRIVAAVAGLELEEARLAFTPAGEVEHEMTGIEQRGQFAQERLADD